MTVRAPALRASVLTRRGLLAGVSAAVLAAQAPDALAGLLALRGGTPPGHGATQTLTVVNTSASATPTDLPIQATMWFSPGDVPAGMIAVPQVGGIDQAYQIDNPTYWGNRSLKGGVFRLVRSSAISGIGSLQLSFVIRAGSYANTSAITTADIVANSDFKVSISDIHTAQTENNQANITALTISGGGVSGGKAWYPSAQTHAKSTLTGSPMLSSGGGTVTVASGTLFLANHLCLIDSEVIQVTTVSGNTLTFTTRGALGSTAAAHAAGATIRMLLPVQNGGGSGAYVYSDAGTVTVYAPGSGYANVGTGAFDASFNAIVAAVASGGNRANGVRVEQYAKGPVCDGWWARTTVPGIDHFHVTIFVERWKKTDGSFLTFKSYAVLGTGLIYNPTTKTLYNYTYDMDWQNGSTVIRGASNGDAAFQSILHFVGGSCGTFDGEAKPDWSANSAAYNALRVRRTPTECDYFKKSRVILPYLNVTPTRAVPTTLSAYSLGSSNGGIDQVCVYSPFGTAGIRPNLGGGGGGDGENPMQEIDALLWMSLRTGAAGVATWERNIRVAAAHAMGFGQLGSGIYEATTLYVGNVVPASSQAFTGMTPTREAISAHPTYFPSLGYTNPHIAGGSLFTFFAATSNTYHQTRAFYGAYLVEGEEWQLQGATNAAATPMFATNPSAGNGLGLRQASLGSTLYPAAISNCTNNERVQAWLFTAMGQAVSAMPVLRADGSTNIERNCLDYCVGNHHNYLKDLIAFTGLVKFGTGSGITKSVDMTGTGLWPENFSPSVASGGEAVVPFMQDYELMETCLNAWLLQGTASGTAVAAVRDHMKIWYVKFWGSPGSHYLHNGYRIKVATAPGSGVPVDWSSGFSVSSPGPGVVPQGSTVGNVAATMSFTNGSSGVTLSDGVRFSSFPSVVMADGSRIMLTPTLVQGAGSPSGVPVPAGLDGTVWYYWKQGAAANVGDLYSDAALTIPAPAGEDQAGVYFWVVPANALPADSAGKGGIRFGAEGTANSTFHTTLGVLRLAKAMGMADDANGNVSTAIANLVTLTSAIPGDQGYAPGPQYAWDDQVPS